MSEGGPFGRRGGAGTGRPADADPEGPRPAGPPPPRRPPSGASRVTWLAGVAFVVLVAYVTLNTVRTDSPGSRGVEVGEPLPPFAVPLALSALEGDANVARRATDDALPACDVRGPDVLNSCALAERGPVVLAFLATRSERCEGQIDVLDRVRDRHPGVRFAAVAIRGDRERLRRLVRDRRWRLPVGYDRDGAVANAYAVAICPSVTFADRSGRVTETSLGFLDEAALSRAVRRVEAGRRE